MCKNSEPQFLKTIGRSYRIGSPGFHFAPNKQ